MVNGALLMLSRPMSKVLAQLKQENKTLNDLLELHRKVQ